MNEGYNTPIYIEWPEQYGIQKASLGENLDQLKEESQKAMNIAMSSIREMAYRISRTIREIDQESTPDEVEVEFSLKLECEGGVVLPMVAKSAVGGQFIVRFKWALEKPELVKAILLPDSET